MSLGGGMLGGIGWGIDAWPVEGTVDGSSLVDRCGLSSALVLSLYFPYPSVPVFPIPIGSIVSHTSHTLWCPLFPTITTLVHPQPDAESCCSVAPSGWLLISPETFLTCLLGSQGRLVGWLGA